jgi:excisionase family DNA binding protein
MTATAADHHQADGLPADDRWFYTVPEFAKLFRLSRAHAYRLVAAGVVPSIRLGGAVRIPRAGLARVLAGGIEAAEPLAHNHS